MACVIGISGHSGVGKTTLIEQVLPVLKNHGLIVGVIKHVHHEIVMDTEGKDSDRFYRAGADIVLVQDKRQRYTRHQNSSEELIDLISGLPRGLDLVFVEGYKEQSIPGIWIEKEGPPGIKLRPDGKRIVSRNNTRYIDEVLTHINLILSRHHKARSVCAGLLISGTTTRMGEAKSHITVNSETLIEESFRALSGIVDTAVLLGSGKVPATLGKEKHLPDAPGISGSLAGMLSAARWAPDSTWLIASVDMPCMSVEAWQWLFGKRKVGIWGILPRIEGRFEAAATTALLEPMIFDDLEAMAKRKTLKLQEVMGHPKVIRPVIPESLVRTLTNVKNATDLDKIPDLNLGENIL